MKSKKFIKTVDDIKYCEENHIVLTDLNNKKAFCIFDNNTWIWSDSKTSLYNVQLSLDGTLYYYEEQEQQEASEKDLGCLCYCWDTSNEEKDLGVLKDYDTSDDDKYHIAGLGYYKHCRRLTPSEVAEITGYKVEKAE